MKYAERCETCGSWEDECSSDKPILDCGCARCLSHTNKKLRREIGQLVLEREELLQHLNLVQTTLSHLLQDADVADSGIHAVNNLLSLTEELQDKYFKDKK